jgi:acetyl esterase/lipase
MIHIKSLLLSILLTFPLAILSQNYRYVQTVFPGSVMTQGIVYGSAPFLNYPYINEAATTVQDLVMDVYQPQDDTLSMRPAIIFAHSGGFVTGSRTVDDMVAFCDTFARKGYVTATIDYRQGLEILDNPDLHYQRGAYRGIQDGRTAVRFLRANASQYGIDPERVYLTGSSAGAFIALNSVYLDADELPAYVGPVSYTAFFQNYTGPDLGDPDIGENLGFNGTPDGIMGLWGGVDDTLKIGTNNASPVFLVHGTADGTVPFNVGPPFGITNLADVYGSYPISIRLAAIGIPARDTYFVEGQDHEFYGTDNGMWSNGVGGNAYWDTIVQKSTTFFYSLHQPEAAFSFTANGLETHFTDQGSGAITWKWDFGDGGISSEQNPVHVYASAGSYMVSQFVQSSVMSWDTVSREVTVYDNSELQDHLLSDLKLFPIPAKGSVTLISSSALDISEINMFDSRGEQVNVTVQEVGSYYILDLNEIPPGIYLIRIQDSGRIICRKLIVK